MASPVLSGGLVCSRHFSAPRALDRQYSIILNTRFTQSLRVSTPWSTWSTRWFKAFPRNNFRQMGLDRLCQKASVSKTSIYHSAPAIAALGSFPSYEVLGLGIGKDLAKGLFARSSFLLNQQRTTCSPTNAIKTYQNQSFCLLVQV